MKLTDIFIPLLIFLGFTFLHQLVDAFYLIGITERMTQIFVNIYFIALFFLDLTFICRIFSDLYFSEKN